MSIITGINPIMISMRDGDAIYINCSDSANSYTFIASVSKLNGLSISVAGNSFIMSTKTSINEVIIVVFIIGICTLLSEVIGLR